MAFSVLEYDIFRFGDILTFLFYANEESDDVTVKKETELRI